MASVELLVDRLTGGLAGWGRSLANALGERGITVNTISPGITRSDMNTWLDEVPGPPEGVADIVALGRVGDPTDIADAVAFFTSPDSRWVTGQVLDVNGGLYLGPKAALHN